LFNDIANNAAGGYFQTGGIALNYGSDNNSVSANNVTAAGIVIFEGDNNTVSSNNLSSAGLSISCMQNTCNSNTFNSNTVKNAETGAGFDIAPAAGATSMFNVISGNEFSFNDVGVSCNAGQNNTFSNNNLSFNNIGIYFNSDCNYNLLEGNTVSTSGDGIQIIGSTYNNLTASSFCYSGRTWTQVHYDVYATSSSPQLSADFTCGQNKCYQENAWNLCTPNVAGTGNCSNQCAPMPSDGTISSCPYTIWYPGAYQLSTDLSCSTYGIRIRSSNVTLDCQNHLLTGPGSSFYYNGIEVYSTSRPYDYGNISISNCKVTSFWKGIRLYASSNDSVTNNVMYGNRIGLAVEESNYSLFENNNASQNTEKGIYVYGDVNYNNFTNNTANYNGEDGIFIESLGGYAEGNTFFNNNASNNNRYGLNSRVGSYSNTFSSNTFCYNGDANYDVYLLNTQTSSTNDACGLNRCYQDYLRHFCVPDVAGQGNCSTTCP